MNTKDLNILTKKEVMELLDISSPTLWRWVKQGVIKQYGLGGKRYFKQAEIYESLESINLS